ncbi:tRNA (adenine(37)-N6)-methyltransferase [Coccinella septempunctata]|uniref:tRNA (adenine(37)-N6)-methyltransferase n=1 Tax=Coccinella septempunctata TaxID=41139 RepID=UPI001D096BA3|nr:tRNA (adenine(37)-N6)-methyltransferase [Coccinella septempunctata]
MEHETLNDFAHLQNQLQMARNEINNLRKQLSQLKYEHKDMCDKISNKLSNFKCENCKSNLTAIQPPTTSRNRDTNYAQFRYIGTISTEFPSKRGIPRQPNVCSEALGKLILNNDVFTNPHHALEGLEKFSHMWILFHFHQTESTHLPAKIAPPRLNGMRLGVFGTRSPHRPSPIGLSLVKINEISGNTITFNGVDMMDKTPVLDIKPFIPHYDVPNSIAYGYSSGNITRPMEEENTSELNEDNSVPQHSESRTLVGQESERYTVPGASNNIDRRSSSFSDNAHLRMVEREAPDGEEEDSVTNSSTNATSHPNSYNNEIRVPQWLDNPVVPTLTVQFRMSAIIQLRQFGAEEEEKKKIIESILSQDPRSIYLREQQGDSEFVFRIAGVYVCCLFDDAKRVVYVNKILMAEEYGPSEISPKT